MYVCLYDSILTSRVTDADAPRGYDVVYVLHGMARTDVMLSLAECAIPLHSFIHISSASVCE